MANTNDLVIHIGTDIEEINRIKSSIEMSPNFIKKCFTLSEINYCMSKKQFYQHFAVRFCAKEAFAKAAGKPQNWHDVEILNNNQGKPIMTLHGTAKDRFSEYKISLSMSHSNEYATATVIIYKQ